MLDSQSQTSLCVLSNDADPWDYVADKHLAYAIKNGHYESNKGPVKFIDCYDCSLTIEEKDVFINNRNTTDGSLILRCMTYLDMSIPEVWFECPYGLGSGATIILKTLINTVLLKTNVYVNNWGNSLHFALKYKSIAFICATLNLSDSDKGVIFAFNGEMSAAVLAKPVSAYEGYQYSEENKILSVGTYSNIVDLNTVIVEEIDGEKFYNWF